MNIFSGIFRNQWIISILVGSAIVQAIIVEFLGVVFATVPLEWQYWLISMAIGSLTLPVGVIVRLLPTWDGCVVMGMSIAVPDNTRIIMTKERLAWHDSINKVRTQLSVFKALRGGRLTDSARKPKTASAEDVAAAAERARLMAKAAEGASPVSPMESAGTEEVYAVPNEAALLQPELLK